MSIYIPEIIYKFFAPTAGGIGFASIIFYPSAITALFGVLLIAYALWVLGKRLSYMV